MSRDNITQQISQITDTLESLAEDNSDDPDIFPAALRAQAELSSLSLSEKRFPKTIEVEVREATPLLVFCYHNQQDYDLILRLNSIEFPYYIPKGTILEVVKNAVTSDW